VAPTVLEPECEEPEPEPKEELEPEPKEEPAPRVGAEGAEGGARAGGEGAGGAGSALKPHALECLHAWLNNLRAPCPYVATMSRA
jgi:hypothetical protein